MKCNKCGKEYISHYYFATENICKECFSEMTPEEQQAFLHPHYYELENNYLRAGFFIRAVAYLIDGIFQFSIVFLLLYSFGLLEEIQGNIEEFLLNQNLLEEFLNKISPFVFAVGFIYYSTEIIFAASPGKMILNLQIANQDRTKSSFNVLSIRFMAKHLDFIISFIAFITAIQFLEIISSIVGTIILIGCFFILTEKKLSFHDMIAKTAVYKTDNIKSEV